MKDKFARLEIEKLTAEVGRLNQQVLELWKVVTAQQAGLESVGTVMKGHQQILEAATGLTPPPAGSATSN